MTARDALLATRAVTAERPTEAERRLAAAIGLPQPSAWTEALRDPGSVEVVLSSDAIADLDGHARGQTGAAGSAAVKPLRDAVRTEWVADGLRRNGMPGAAAAAMTLALRSAFADFADFLVAGRDCRSPDDSALLHVRRLVRVESSQEDGSLGVDYELRVLRSLALGPFRELADAGCHAALALQMDRDMVVLGRSLARVGYGGEVLCNVVCHVEGLRPACERIAALLTARQDAASATHRTEDGFPSFREPSVLDC